MTTRLNFVYTNEKSIQVFYETEKFLEENSELLEKIQTLTILHHAMWGILPQTLDNLWSGHCFPFRESWDEAQIGYNLAFFGLYKQAFVSLRSMLELGLLSVYYNINDEGHKTVRDWLLSGDSWEANTPRTDKIWQVLLLNNNIQRFNNKFNIRALFNELSFLSNYVHTKGQKYSNQFGTLKGNFQTFEKSIFLNWINTYEKILTLLIILHLLKYPIGVVKYNWDTKCGIDNPYPVLNARYIEDIENILPKEYFEELKNISEQDEDTQELLDYIKNLPDKTLEDIEEQIVEQAKMLIKGMGFLDWEKYEKSTFKLFSEDDIKKCLQRIQKLREWAIENGCVEKPSFGK